MRLSVQQFAIGSISWCWNKMIFSDVKVYEKPSTDKHLYKMREMHHVLA